MSPKTQRQEHTPASVKQAAAAMAALGAYTGNNTSAEHAAQAARLAALTPTGCAWSTPAGVVQAQAVLAGAVPLDEQARDAAWDEHLRSAGAGPDEVAARLELIRWQVLRSATPLRQMAQNRQVGPIPLAAAHGAEALQVLLGVIAASQDAVATSDVTTLAAQTSQLRTAHEAMSNALASTDLLLNMLRSVGL